MKDEPPGYIYELCEMDSARIVVCWISKSGESGTNHCKPITISAKGAIWPEFARTYLPTPRPADGAATFFEVDHAAPDADQIIFGYELNR